MRIAMIDPYFAFGMGYQPTGWFNALAAQGHQVRAFCSCYTPTVVRHLYPEPFPEGLAQVNGGEVLRLRSRLMPRDIVKCSGLLPEVLAYAPELTLATYPGTLFAHPVIANRPKLTGMFVTAFGENTAQRHNSVPGLGQVFKNVVRDAAFWALKRRFYREAMEASDVVFLQTPDTFDYLLPRIGGKSWRERIRPRCVLSPLGFEASVFTYNPMGRREERRRLGVADDEVLALYACKIRPEKRLDLWVSIMAEAMRRVPKLKAMLIGIRDGELWSRQACEWIEATGLRDRFLCLPFAQREMLARLSNAADFGFWHMQPAVTIQECMGTGLFMILPKAATVSHLLQEGQTGQYFPEGDYARAAEIVVNAAMLGHARDLSGDFYPRSQCASFNASRFSYEALARRLVNVASMPHLAVESLVFAVHCKT